MSATPPDYRHPPPFLGQHTREVLTGELGLDDAQLIKLAAEGVIGLPD